MIRASVQAGIVTGKFVKGQIDQKFWREPGKLRFVIGLLLLAIAYGFYGGDQPRPLWEALLDIGRGQILAVMPLAILTQWILLLAFWMLFGLVMGVSFVKLGKPISDMAIGMVVFGAEMVLFTLALMSLVEGQGLAAFGWLLAFAALNLPLAFAARAQLRKKGLPERPVAILWLLYMGLIAALFAFIAFCVVIVFWVGELAAPNREGVVKGVLIGLLVLTLIMCFRFHGDVLSQVEVPKSLMYFIDFSLALAAGVVAVIGVQETPVTLGPVPAWVVAVGPPLIVAGMILFSHLRGMRESTPRWTACLVAGVLAAFLVLPATLGLTRLLGPVLPSVDLPFL